MASLINLARMTTLTTGTGTITLGSAVSGFLSFAGAGATDGGTYTYAITDGSNSEIGRGVYTTSGTTLTRTVLKSTNSNTAISLSGTAEVFITAAAEDFLQKATAGLTSTEKLNARTNIDVGTTKDGRRNRIINSGMMVSAENGTTSGSTDGYYPVDQWSYQKSHNGTVTVAQVASATAGGSPNRIRATVTDTHTSIGAGPYAYIMQRIEGAMVSDFLYGGASAKQVVLRMGIKAPAGTYCVSLTNATTARSYLAEVVVSGGEANADTVKTFVIAGDTSGTWATGVGATGIALRVCLTGGSTYQGSTGWSSGNYLCTSNQSNFLGTNSQVFELFDVGLYLDYDSSSVIPQFELRHIGEETFDCARYFEVTTYPPFYLGLVSGVTVMYLPRQFVTKSLTPTVALSSSTNAAFNGSGSNVTPSTWQAGSISKYGYQLAIANGSNITGHNDYTATINGRLS